MTASELITILESAIEASGDLRVVIADGDYGGRQENVVGVALVEDQDNRSLKVFEL